MAPIIVSSLTPTPGPLKHTLPEGDRFLAFYTHIMDDPAASSLWGGPKRGKGALLKTRRQQINIRHEKQPRTAPAYSHSPQSGAFNPFFRVFQLQPAAEERANGAPEGAIERANKRH